MGDFSLAIKNVPFFLAAKKMIGAAFRVGLCSTEKGSRKVNIAAWRRVNHLLCDQPVDQPAAVVAHGRNRHRTALEQIEPDHFPLKALGQGSFLALVFDML